MDFIIGVTSVLALVGACGIAGAQPRVEFELTGVTELDYAGSEATGADVNGDGRMDLVSVRAMPNDSICVFLNRGEGAAEPFAETPTCSPIAPFSQFAGIAFGDFNEDGMADAAAGHLDGDPTALGIFLGTPSGAFEFAGAVSNGAQTRPGVGVGDFDGDGHLDLVSSTGGVSPQLTVVLGDGAGAFGEPIISGETTGSAGIFLSADLDGDTDTDVAYLRDHSPSGLDSVNTLITINLNNGDATFTPVQSLSCPTTLDDARLGNVDGDNLPDIMLYGYKGDPNFDTWGGVRLLRNSGGGQFELMHLTGWLNLPYPAESAELADLTGDGAGEVVVVRRSGNDEDAFIWANDGAGNFDMDAAVLTAREYSSEVTAFDFTGSDLADLVIFDNPLFGPPDAYLAYENLTTEPDPCPADFNGDGVVNTQDVLAFLNAWTAGDPRGDFNGDGTVNTQDVLAFLNAWAGGC